MKRAQIVCIGASSMYGVGGSQGGWPDILKRNLHTKMYSGGMLSESYEVYNLGIPGAKMADMHKRVKTELEALRKPGKKLITLLHLGANDARADNHPSNYVSSLEQYRTISEQFLTLLLQTSDKVVALGIAPTDEKRTAPWASPASNKKIYFFNQRIREFEDCLGATCKTLGITFKPIHAQALDAGWTETHLFKDGLHPNDIGHLWLYNQIRPQVFDLLGIT